MFGLFNSGAGAGGISSGAATGASATGGSSVGGIGTGALGGLGAAGLYALPVAYVLGGLAGGSADPETFGKLPLVGTTGEALNGLFNGKWLTEFFDSDNIAQNLLPGIGDFMTDKQADDIFKPVSNFFGNIFGF